MRRVRWKLVPLDRSGKVWVIDPKAVNDVERLIRLCHEDLSRTPPFDANQQRRIEHVLSLAVRLRDSARSSK